MLYDIAHKNGFLYHALLNNQKKKRKAANSIELPNGEGNFSQEEKEEILNFFKRCVPNDRHEVKKKMMDTKAFRREMILTDLKKYQTCWDFYFHMPNLVSFQVK